MTVMLIRKTRMETTLRRTNDITETRAEVELTLQLKVPTANYLLVDECVSELYHDNMARNDTTMLMQKITPLPPLRIGRNTVLSRELF